MSLLVILGKCLYWSNAESQTLTAIKACREQGAERGNVLRGHATKQIESCFGVRMNVFFCWRNCSVWEERWREDTLPFTCISWIGHLVIYSVYCNNHFPPLLSRSQGLLSKKWLSTGKLGWSRCYANQTDVILGWVGRYKLPFKGTCVYGWQELAGHE